MGNEQARLNLVATIATDAIAMVGAGSSRRVGFPLWPALVNRLSDEAQKTQPDKAEYLSSIKNSPDLLLRAGECQKLLGRDAICAQVAEIYGPEVSPFDDFHRTLLRLPFRHFLSGNYDRVLETAQQAEYGSPAHHFDFHRREKLQEFIDRCRSGEYPRSIVHIHGSIGDPDGIVLTLGDYDRRYQNENWAKTALLNIFTLYPCVFIGCGLGEEDLGPLRFLTAVLGPGPTTKHFAILEQPAPADEPALRLRLAERYRIEPVFYPVSEGHQALLPFMVKLLEDVENYKRRLETHRQRNARDKLAALMEPVLDNDPGKRDALERAWAEAVRELGGTAVPPSTLAMSSAGDTDGEERTPIDDEIDAAFRYVRVGEPKIAIELYQKLLVREGRRLSQRLLYRIHANLGNAHYSTGMKEEAAHEYLVAAPLRDSRDARALEGMAYVLRRDYVAARGLAQSLCSREPGFARGYWLLVTSLRDGTSFCEAQALVPPEIRKDAEVACALGGLALEQNLMDEAEHYARLAVESAPEWPDPLLNLAATLLTAEKLTATVDVGRGLVPRNAERVAEAEALMTRAISLIPKTDPGNRLGTAYLNRASARRFLGQIGEADEDTRESYRRDPLQPEIASSFALLLERIGNPERAIQTLTALPKPEAHWRATFLLAVLLRQRGTSQDRGQALSLLTSWRDRAPQIGPEAASDLAQLGVALHLDVNEPQGARQFLEAIPTEVLPPGRREILFSQIHQKAGAIEDATASLRAGVGRLGDDGDWFARREAARLAEDLGELGLALSLWKNLVPRTLVNADALHTLHLAWNAQDDAFILDFCRNLRQNRVEDRSVTVFEIDTLARCREPVAAIALAKRWLEDHPDDREMRLQLSVLGIARGEKEIVEHNPDRLPAVTAVKDARTGAAVVQVLRHGPAPINAAKYAYELCRRFPDDPAAQGALIFAVFGPTKAEIEFAQPSRVGPDCAVIYRESGSGTQLIAIAETGPNPSPSRSEYAPDHPLVQSMLDKAPGGTFAYLGREHAVLAVTNKVLYRTHEYMQAYDRNFPGNGLVRRFSVASDIDKQTDPKKALGEMWKVLEADDERQRRLEALYAERVIPIPLLAQRLDRSVIETMGYLCAKRGVAIRCSNSLRNEWHEARTSLEKTKDVVLDSTAIATVYLLGLHTALKQLPFHCIVPDAAIQEIRDVIRQFDRSPGHFGYIGVRDGRLILQETSIEDEEARIVALEELVHKLETDCEVVGGSAILELSPEHREGLTRVLGPGVADAIAIARKKGAALWTDDFMTGEVARQEWGIPRMWTHFVLSAAQDALGTEAVDAAVSKMVTWGYEFTLLSVRAAVKLLRAGGWRTDHAAAVPAVNQIVRFGALSPHNCVVTALLVNEIWRSCKHERVAKTLIRKLLDAVGRAEAGPQIARPLYRRPLPKAGHGKIQKMRRLSRFLRRWRSRSTGP